MFAAVLPPTPALTITPAAIHATAGVSLTTAVASFVPASPLDTLSQYAALIAWGDGQVSAGALGSSSSGTFIVSGTHTWVAGGSYPVTVTVFSGSASWIGQATAVVAPVSTPPQFTAAAPPLTATAGADVLVHVRSERRPRADIRAGLRRADMAVDRHGQRRRLGHASVRHDELRLQRRRIERRQPERDGGAIHGHRRDEHDDIRRRRRDHQWSGDRHERLHGHLHRRSHE